MDDFEDHVRKVLGEAATPEKLAALSAHREEFQKLTEKFAGQANVANAAEAAASINDAISQTMMKAAEILGPEDFAKVFGTEPRKTFALGDPEQFAASEAAYEKSLKE